MHGTSTESKKRAFVMLVESNLEYTAPVWSSPKPLSMCSEELPIGYVPSGTGPTENAARHMRRLG